MMAQTLFCVIETIINMYRSIFILIFILVNNSSIAQWQLISNQGDGELFFVNDTLGFGLSKRTTDGGFTWQTLTSGTNAGIFFTDADTGHMIVNSNTGPPTYLRSFNSGISWTDMSAVFPDPYGAVLIHFPASGTGYAGTEKFYKTSDGGNNWNMIHAGTIIGHSMHFTTVDTGYIGGSKLNTGPILLRTFDGGLNWDSLPIPFFSANSYQTIVFPATSSDIYAINAGDNVGEILYSSDAGLNWVTQFLDTNLTFLDIHFPTRDTGYVTGSNYQTGAADFGLVLKTTNGGLNWTVQQTGYNKIIGRCYFIDGHRGWVSGAFGDVLYTDSGGETVGLNDLSDSNKWRLNPNPASQSTVLEFENPEQESHTLMIYDLQGRVVEKITRVTTEQVIVNTANLNDGLYLFQLLNTGTVRFTGKLMVNN